jgi:hypothetical protein
MVNLNSLVHVNLPSCCSLRTNESGRFDMGIPVAAPTPFGDTTIFIEDLETFILPAICAINATRVMMVVLYKTPGGKC